MLRNILLFFCMWIAYWRFLEAASGAIFRSYPQFDVVSGMIPYLGATATVLTLLSFPDERAWLRNLFRRVSDRKGIDRDLWISSLKSERVAVGLFGVLIGCIVNALVFHTSGRELSGVLFWGINLAWTHLCYAWIFHGSRPLWRGGGPGEAK